VLAAVLVLGASGADLVGGYLATALGAVFRPKLILFIGFAGGFLFALAALEIVPESMKALPVAAPLLVLGGYLFTFAGEQIWCTHHHHEHEDDHGDHLHRAHADHAGMLLVSPSTSVAMVAGMTMHSFFDGVAVGAGAAVGGITAILIFLGIAIHKIPSTFGLSSVAYSASGSKRNAMWAAAVCAGATLVGAVVTKSIAGLGTEVRSGILCVAAGTFIYVAATDLLPLVHRNRSYAATASVIIGALVYYATAIILRAVGAE
jgi:zinc transporter ZupT